MATDENPAYRPYLMSRINWKDPANDPIFKQFINVGSFLIKDHPRLKLDPLGERADKPVDGVVHRYPDKALFLREGNTTLFTGSLTDRKP